MQELSMITRLIALFIILTRHISPAASRQNYNSYHYDMTTPQFTPDGRLLQVEYASMATTHSSPCIIWKLNSNTAASNDVDDDDALLFITRRPKLSKSLLQTRFVLINHNNNDDDNNKSFGTRGENNNNANVVVVLSGMLSDALALMKKVSEVEDEYLGFYAQPSLTPQQMAQAISDECQQHSFGGGIRPYGASILITQFSTNQMIQTEPSGSLTHLDQQQSIHVVGGTPSEQAQIRKAIDEEQITTVRPILEAIRIAARALTKSNQKSKKDPLVNNVNLEVVVQTREYGARRLTDHQIQSILQSDDTSL